MLSLTYNHHLNQSYAADVALEPIIWIVDNYAHFLGRVSAPKFNSDYETGIEHGMPSTAAHLTMSSIDLIFSQVFRSKRSTSNIGRCICCPLDWTSILVGTK